MLYYEVSIASQRFHGQTALTYSADVDLETGSIVAVNLQQQIVLGIVEQRVKKPSFSTKSIVQIISETPLPKQCLDLMDWLRQYYPAPHGSISNLFLPTSILQPAREKPRSNVSDAGRAKAMLPSLTKEQLAAVSLVKASTAHSHLLHGVTGSGKTRVYIELLGEALQHGRSALVLTPEIGLTSQLAKTLEASFNDQTVVVHSNLSPAQRRDLWFKILSARQPLIIIGPRSALFSPIHNLGVIIIDEAHDQAYKQEQLPRYQATRVAAQLAKLHGSKLILGTATPSVSDYYTFQTKGLPIATMNSLAKGTTETNISIVDLKNRELFTQSSWLSDALVKEVDAALHKNLQSLVFLNRRGSARLVLCQNCGWQALCPRCDLPLTYHADSHNLRCHTCGFSNSTPVSCPVCQSTDIIFRSIGTKTLVEELHRLFPKAKIRRFDSDLKKAERLEQQYESIQSGDVDILVGTQMITKGLDLPKLSVVGIVVADTNLSFPDYTAEERTYQLLTQAIGRVGRGHLPGIVILQTYYPEGSVIKAATKNDYQKMFSDQLAEREQYGFPPFRFLLKLGIARASEAATRKASEILAVKLREESDIEVVGPSPAFVKKTNNRFRWQIVVKAKRRSKLTSIINNLPSGWDYDIDPSHLL